MKFFQDSANDDNNNKNGTFCLSRFRHLGYSTRSQTMADRQASSAQSNETNRRNDSLSFWIKIERAKWHVRIHTYLVQKLNVHNAKNEDEFVENEIPEFIFEMLLLGYA